MGPKTWLPGMRNLYFVMPSEFIISVRSFTNFLDDKGSSFAAGNENSQVPATTSNFLQRPQPQPQNHISSVEFSKIKPPLPQLKPYGTKFRRIVNCDGCGCGELNCDSCWCQCDDENFNGPNPANQLETDDSVDKEEEEDDDEEKEENDDDNAWYGRSSVSRQVVERGTSSNVLLKGYTRSKI